MNAYAPIVDVSVQTHAVVFRGRGAEYFRIWIVNVALILLTLGLYSPWASVRTRRYFHGSTTLAGHAFEYHGAPWRLLLGRGIAAALLAVFLLSAVAFPPTLWAWPPALGAAFAWLVNGAIRYNARNTSWRGVRFNFCASYREALIACALWPAAAVLVFLLVPHARRIYDRFRINHYSFDGRVFRTEYSAARMFSIYAVAFVLIVGVLVLMIGVTMAVLLVTTRMHDLARHFYIPIDPSNFGQVFALLFGTCAVFIAIFATQMASNLALSSTVIEGGHRIVSRASPWRVAWTVLSNLALTVLTLGLFHPFAKVRLARYRMNRYEIVVQGDMDDFVSEALEMQSTVGRELAGPFAFGL